jgi:hypothetical protein
MNPWLDAELQRGLRPVSAPAELWDRVQGKPLQAPVPRATPSNRGLVWALAGAVALAVVALSLVHSPDEALALQALADNSQQIAFRCQNPAQLRAWVRAQTGLDVPLRDARSASIELIGARADGGRVEIAYRASDRDAVLLVSRADSWAANGGHSRVSGNVSSWVTAGQRFTLASDNAADLQLACKLCHPD